MQLVRKAGDNETDYKFHRSIKLGAGEETTVWASEAGTTHDAPHNLVMKGQTWFVADKMTTTLFDMEGEVSLPLVGLGRRYRLLSVGRCQGTGSWTRDRGKW